LESRRAILSNGVAGTIEAVRLDEEHGLRISIRGHTGFWPVSKVKIWSTGWKSAESSQPGPSFPRRPDLRHSDHLLREAANINFELPSNLGSPRRTGTTDPPLSRLRIALSQAPDWLSGWPSRGSHDRPLMADTVEKSRFADEVKNSAAFRCCFRIRSGGTSLPHAIFIGDLGSVTAAIKISDLGTLQILAKNLSRCRFRLSTVSAQSGRSSRCPLPAANRTCAAGGALVAALPEADIRSRLALRSAGASFASSESAAHILPQEVEAQRETERSHKRGDAVIRTPIIRMVSI